MEILIVFGVIALILILWVIGIVNRLTRLKNLVKESWAQMDVALKRRYDLVPNLVETVRAYAAHERDTLERVIAARNQAVNVQGDAHAQIPAEAVFVSALNGLLTRAEAYPQLRSNENFLSLQRELANTEDRIAAARRFYNANVRDYNTAQEQFPSSLFAAGHKPADFFEIDDVSVRQTPEIKL
ncbi:MAG: LemA family protein [Fimbriimonas sp.]